MVTKAFEQQEYHSRWDSDHYDNCSDCYEDHLDAMQDMEHDAQMDAYIDIDNIGDDDEY